MSLPQKILITGASGFVGSQLAKRLRLLWPEAHLILTDHRSRSDGLAGVHRLDVSEDDAVRAFIREVRPTVVFHLAAVAAISNAMDDVRHTWRVNGVGPVNVAMALLEHAPDCHLLFVSSAEVYGRSAAEGIKLSEEHLLRPANPYASAKAAADLFIQEAAGRGLYATVMRPFNHIGPTQSLDFAIPSFCSQIVDIERGNASVLRVGSLEDVRDFLHVDDVIDAYIAAVESREKLPQGSLFNVASGVPVKMQQLVDRLIALSIAPVTIEVDKSRLRGRPPTSVVGDASRLQSTLHWRPRRTLEDALRETLEYWRAKE